MAVLVEAISVVVRLETIAEKYPGSVNQYIADCPNGTLCMDDDIVRVGFMYPDDAYAFIENLEHLGFRYIVDEQFDEIAMVDQIDGIVLPCDWLEYLKLVLFKGDIRVRICKSKGKPPGDVVFPPGWNYETSLSKHTFTLDRESEEARMVFLRHEDGIDYYLDVLTGQEHWIERTIRQNFNA